MRFLYMCLIVFPGICLSAEFNYTPPNVQTKNGTIQGRYLAQSWEQDLFLGIPFAEPPVNSLRFKRPRGLNQTYSKALDASQYGFSCYQHPNILTSPDLVLSEDCLTLNVVRPHGNYSANESLPVLVWIYGGGFFSGSSADPQYNLSGLVRNAQDAQRPIIAVSLNYRVGVMGFLQTPQLFADGHSNAGLLDQRLGFRWIKENIAAFGGDPDKITIWGESSGAQSIALHLHSYGGRDDGLFQGAIMESGGFVGTPLLPSPYYVSQVNGLAEETGCANATDVLTCLQQVPARELYAASSSNFYWNPIVDGDFLTDYPSSLARNGTFIKIPLLIGANSDEGTTFSPHVAFDSTSPRLLDNSSEIFDALLTDPGFIGMPGLPYQISPASARRLLELYPNEPSSEPPYDIKNNTIFPENGLQWRRSAAIFGDIVMIGSRRQLCREYALVSQPVFSYRFATRPWNGSEADGVGHFVNVVFSFQNISGALGPLPEFQRYRDLSMSIGRAYVNFVHDHDPNGASGRGGSALPDWPKWTVEGPVNMVLNATQSGIEADTFREEGIRFINSISRELLG